MIDLTPEASTRLERYLERMRGALRGSRTVEPCFCLECGSASYRFQ